MRGQQSAVAPPPRTIAKRPPLTDDLPVLERTRTRRRAHFSREALAAADALAAALTLALVALVGSHLPLAFVAFAPLIVLPAKLAGLYDRDELVVKKSTIEELPTICRLSVYVALLVWLAHADLHRTDVVAVLLVLVVTCFAARAAARVLARRVLPPERCLLIGDPGLVERVADKLDRNGAQLVGFVAQSEGEAPGTHALHETVRRLDADRVIVALGGQADTEAGLETITRAKDVGVRVSILPRMLEVVGSSVEFDHVDGLVMLGIRRFGLTRSSAVVKRAADLTGAGLALLVAAPVMALAALAIRLEGGGPILFRQVRVGRNGERFTMLKFRTMHDGADQLRAELQALSTAGDGMFKVADDPRVTRVGRILRKLSLDELPQLLNVLRGEMSLVGPRPLVLDEDARIFGWHRRRLHLTPGLTGPWQVLGTGTARVPLRDMVTIDYLYAANWSLWSDIKVLLRTVAHVCRARGV